MSEVLLNRTEIRALILSSENLKRKTLVFTFFGAEIELRQPTTGDIMRYMEESTRTMSLVNILLDYAYIPGTDEKVFEAGDIDTLKQLPYNEDMQKLTKVIEQFTNVIVSDAEKN